MTSRVLFFLAVGASLNLVASHCPPPSHNPHHGYNAPCGHPGWTPACGDWDSSVRWAGDNYFNHHHYHHQPPFHHGHGGYYPNGCAPEINQIVTPGRVVIKEPAPVITEYCEGEPLVLHQENAPHFVFKDATPIRISHHAKPAVIEHFETPYVIDAFQKQHFINHAAKPVVIDHYEAPVVVRDDLPGPIFDTCDCAPAADCHGYAVPAPCPCGNPKCTGCAGCF